MKNRHLLATFGLVIGHCIALAQDPTDRRVLDVSEVSVESYDPTVCHRDGIALGGIDVVSYWEPDGPRPGQTQLSAVHRGLTYRFVNEANLAKFRSQPDRYLPTYDGWCATTLALGKLTCPDFRNFKLENDALLLFETSGFTNGQTIWERAPALNRQHADRYFEQLRRIFQ